MKPFVHELVNFDPVEAFSAVKDMRYSLFLDSADTSHSLGRFSFVCCNPIETIEAKNGKVVITNWDGQTLSYAKPFDVLKERMEKWIPLTQTIEELPPFQGGAAGFFGYDLARGIEDIKASSKDPAIDNVNMPDMAIGIYDQVFAHDHKENKSWIITHATSAEDARIKQKHLLRLFTQVEKEPQFKEAQMDWEANFDACEYKNHIQKVIDYIHSGDVFQVNLSQRFDAKLPDNLDPFSHYISLRKANPAPFSTYMNLGYIKISSCSPERFVSIEDQRVQTRPIKGTRPRVDDPELDKKYQKDLLCSEKDLAENTMIVDLLRNDLSKVCQKNSVIVKSLCKLESFASVHHLVSVVEGQLRKGKTAIDLLKAGFPGGSITGAPKIRAMEIIEELEPTRRGPYCGCMGYIGFDGNMDSNILIRSLVYEGKNVSLQVGSGIVSDSCPDTEYQETFDKASAIFDSFEGHSDIEIEDLAKTG